MNNVSFNTTMQAGIIVTVLKALIFILVKLAEGLMHLSWILEDLEESYIRNRPAIRERIMDLLIDLSLDLEDLWKATKKALCIILHRFMGLAGDALKTIARACGVVSVYAVVFIAWAFKMSSAGIHAGLKGIAKAVAVTMEGISLLQEGFSRAWAFRRELLIEGGQA